MAYRFNAPPGWPAQPEGWRPPPDWRPDPSWPEPPPGWQMWVDDAAAPGPEAVPTRAGPAGSEPAAEPVADTRRPGEKHGRLHLLIAISIGLVSVLGAVVLWRTETHAANANTADQNAITASITAAHLHSVAEQAADTAQRRFARYQRLGLEAERLDPGHSCSNRNQNPITLPEADAVVACEVHVLFSGYADETSEQGSYDISEYTDDVLAFTRYFHPQSDPAPFEQVAASQRHLEHELLWLSLGLVGVLALFTLARLGRTERECLVLAVPGWVLFAAAIATLLAMEL